MLLGAICGAYIATTLSGGNEPSRQVVAGFGVAGAIVPMLLAVVTLCLGGLGMLPWTRWKHYPDPGAAEQCDKHRVAEH